MVTYYVRSTGKRPDLATISNFLGDLIPIDCQFSPNSAWSGDITSEAVDNGRTYATIEPHPSDPAVCRVDCRSETLAARVAYFVARDSSGRISLHDHAVADPPELLVPLLGDDFDLEAAFTRVQDWRLRLPPFFQIHWSFLTERNRRELFDVTSCEHGRSLLGRASHTNLRLSDWVGKSHRRCVRFADDADVPDGLFACFQVAWLTQEWAFVLMREQNRRFWFGSPFQAIYRSADASPVTLKRALEAWDRGADSIYMMSGWREIRTDETVRKPVWLEWLPSITTIPHQGPNDQPGGSAS